MWEVGPPARRGRAEGRGVAMGISRRSRRGCRARTRGPRRDWAIGARSYCEQTARYVDRAVRWRRSCRDAPGERSWQFRDRSARGARRELFRHTARSTAAGGRRSAGCGRRAASRASDPRRSRLLEPSHDRRLAAPPRRRSQTCAGHPHAPGPDPAFPADRRSSQGQRNGASFPPKTPPSRASRLALVDPGRRRYASAPFTRVMSAPRPPSFSSIRS